MEALWQRVDVWIAFGLAGQLLFSARFLVQWIASELRGESVVPVSFWFLSIGGSLILLIYAIHLRDPVFILGQSVGSLIYGRNLAMIHRRRLEEGSGRTLLHSRRRGM